MRTVEQRISDRRVLALLRAMLRAGVVQDGSLRHPTTGTPQGGVISPLLCNVYLHRLDRSWQAGEHGTLVRYADDLVVMCATRRQAVAAWEQIGALLRELGLEPKAAKTRVVHLREGGEGFDFLGFHHRLVRAKRPNPLGKRIVYLARWPSRKAMQHARDRIRGITVRSRLWLSDKDIVEDLNRFLRGWAGYFRFGNSSDAFRKIRQYALERLARFVAKRHGRRRGWGLMQVARFSPDNYGLIRLDGTVVAPRISTYWAGRTAECRR